MTKDSSARCRLTSCGQAPCPWLSTLSGETVDSDGRESVLAPDTPVRIWPADAPTASVLTTSGPRARYRFLVPAGMTAFVQPERPGFLPERHAVTMPARGWDIPLDLRHPATFRRILGEPASFDPMAGLMVTEFVGEGDLAGLGLVTDVTPADAFAFDAQLRPIRSDALLPGGYRLLFRTGMSTSFVARVVQSSAQECAIQATGVTRWPAEPGVIVQIDVECTPRPKIPPRP